MSFCFVRASSAALFVLSALLCTVGVSATLGAEMELFAVPSRIRFSKPLVGTSGPSGRYGGALIPVGEESFYLIGGCTIRGDGTKELHNDMWQLNLGPENSVEWVELEASAPWAPRMLHAVAQLDDGSLLLSGGETQEGLASDVWQYSPEMNQWSLVIDSAPWKGRAGHVMAVAEDYVYLSGGFVNQRTEGNCDLWRASLYSLERWKMISSYSAAKTCPVLSGYAVPPRVAASQTISMFGGRSVRMVDSQVTFHNSEWSVTPSDMSFSGWRMVRGKARWEPRFAPGVAANGDTVVLVGGQVCKTASASQKGCESEPLADVWVRMKGLEWIPAPEDLPKPVAFPAVATLTNKIVVFGGRGKDGTSDDMYITCDYGYQVDPSGWDCQLCPNGTLPGRVGGRGTSGQRWRDWIFSTACVWKKKKCDVLRGKSRRRTCGVACTSGQVSDGWPREPL